MAQEKIFANGLLYKEPRERAPSWVKGSLSIKVADFVEFLQKHETNSGWVNIDIKESQGGKLYCELNTYKPQRPDGITEPDQRAQKPRKQEETPEEPEGAGYPTEDINPDDIPF